MRGWPRLSRPCAGSVGVDGRRQTRAPDGDLAERVGRRSSMISGAPANTNPDSASRQITSPSISCRSPDPRGARGRGRARDRAQPTRHGFPSSRATTAACEVRPPAPRQHPGRRRATAAMSSVTVSERTSTGGAPSRANRRAAVAGRAQADRSRRRRSPGSLERALRRPCSDVHVRRVGSPRGRAVSRRVTSAALRDQPFVHLVDRDLQRRPRRALGGPRLEQKQLARPGR